MISAVSFVEASVIAETNGGDGGVRQLDSYLRVARISIAPVAEEVAFWLDKLIQTLERGGIRQD